MSLSADWKEFIELLNGHDVEYVVVGAHCLAFHARPRFTGDIDFLIRPSLENAARILAVLHAFGFEELSLSASDFMQPDTVIQLGRAPSRIDLLTSITGVAIEDAFRTRLRTEMAGLPIYILSRETLIANKRAVGRPQDMADLEALRGTGDLPD